MLCPLMDVCKYCNVEIKTCLICFKIIIFGVLQIKWLVMKEMNWLGTLTCKEFLLSLLKHLSLYERDPLYL